MRQLQKKKHIILHLTTFIKSDKFDFFQADLLFSRISKVVPLKIKIKKLVLENFVILGKF